MTDVDATVKALEAAHFRLDIHDQLVSVDNYVVANFSGDSFTEALEKARQHAAGVIRSRIEHHLRELDELREQLSALETPRLRRN